MWITCIPLGIWDWETAVKKVVKMPLETSSKKIWKWVWNLTRPHQSVQTRSTTPARIQSRKKTSARRTIDIPPTVEYEAPAPTATRQLMTLEKADTAKIRSCLKSAPWIIESGKCYTIGRMTLSISHLVMMMRSWKASQNGPNNYKSTRSRKYLICWSISRCSVFP